MNNAGVGAVKAGLDGIPHRSPVPASPFVPCWETVLLDVLVQHLANFRIAARRIPLARSSKETAVAEIDRDANALAIRRNVIGVAQVNAFWHGHRVKSPFDLLDPQTNLTIAAQILNENFRRYPKDAFKAIGAYHSREPSKSFRYARYVIRVYSALKGV